LKLYFPSAASAAPPQPPLHSFEKSRAWGGRIRGGSAPPRRELPVFNIAEERAK
jgi:hypothetical protein